MKCKNCGHPIVWFGEIWLHRKTKPCGNALDQYLDTVGCKECQNKCRKPEVEVESK